MIAAGCELKGRSGHDAGIALLQLLYLEQTGQELPSIRVTQRGKPYFVDSPLHFSITHTNRHAFCVLAESPVGIDAEELTRPVRQSLVPKVLSPAEMERYHSAPDTRRAFLSLWVQKEADAKRSGKGLHGFPNHTDFFPEDPRVREWMGCLVALFSDDPNEGVTYYAF